ncbi:hypothetical protein AB0C93_18805 [Streptomyces sp. NPDC048518]|uniref:hypothetical protein n=1 Tax=Streptomyces sp. NPDC048518 TaxID=3155029 RepID=UPI0034100935
MMTAWSPSGARRNRSVAVLWRAVGLGLFLFGLVFVHVASPEATSRHLTVFGGVGMPGAGAVVRATSAGGEAVDAPVVAGAPGGPRHDHRQQHTVEECALSQPPQGPDVDLPCLSPLGSRWRPGAPASTHAAHRIAGRDFVVPIAHAADSTILRI